jgi:DNA-3-methyladenine glycosylase II
MVFDDGNFQGLCALLSERDADLRGILDRQGYPPMWTRKEGFATLILIILEQQVSLASAYAAFRRLKQKIGRVTPRNVLALSDEELRACSFSRQKIGYARELAEAVQSGRLRLGALAGAGDEEIRSRLKEIKGIGDWTVDVYLMHALRRCDLFPLGDVALVSSLRETKELGSSASKDEMLAIAEAWRPYRTIAAMILWHAYIRKRGLKIEM